MTDDKGKIRLETRERLGRYPPGVLREFDLAWQPMSEGLQDGQLSAWAQRGINLAAQTVRSWEAAVQYFKVSPAVLGLMPFSYFIRWAECGSDLCSRSPVLAVAYFQASPGTMATLRSRHIEVWANLGGKLYKGTWKSSTVATKYFEASPTLVRSMTLAELERFVSFLESLSHRSYDVAAECLVLGEKVLPLIGRDKEAFIDLASVLVQTSWRQVKGFFDAGARSLPKIDQEQRLRFLKLADQLAQRGGTNVPAVMLDVSSSLGELETESHGSLLELAEQLMEVSPEAVPSFLKSSPSALARVSPSQLQKWFDEGTRLLQQNNEAGQAYFRLESAYSESVLEALSSSVEFSRIKDVLEMYCLALAGAEVQLSTSGELVEKNIGWVSAEAPSTEGSTIYVPTVEDRYPSKDENFSWFKVVSTHQVAHIEFGSFDFEFQRPSVIFEDIRPSLGAAADGGPSLGAAADGGPSLGAAADGPTAWATDMQRFFSHFDDRALALDIFTVVEDGRLDARVKVEYPGISAAYLRVQGDSLDARPELTTLPAREAMVEFLVRVSLKQTRELQVPRQHKENALKIARIAERVFVPKAEVEDTAEATLRIYAVLAEVDNEAVPEDEWDDVDIPDQQADEDEDLEELIQQAMGMGEGEGEPGEEGERTDDAEADYEPAQQVDFRGDFKPELVQLLAQLRQQSEDDQGGESGEEITAEMLEQALEDSAEVGNETQQGQAPMDSSALANSMLNEAGMDVSNNPDLGQGPPVHVDENGGPLDASEPQSFVYDEWDFRAQDYKPRWCVVRQKIMGEGDAEFYGSTLHSYSALVSQVRRQFELMVPEMFRKVRRLEDGEDIDIDDVIEAFVDMRSGASPSDRYYWRRNKVQRDVAVAFLLDTSASTAEAIDEARKLSDDWNAPDDPVEYMVWLRTRRGEGPRRSYKRIIDLEKEAVVLLIDALEAIGDTYGIYGFSGYGRENVEFYTVKDINEGFTERIKKRIDRLAPLHATRMGPAIRHATSKLETQDARTKLLFLISDGRPQDRGYSREGVEKEYAVHDTKKALDEAKAKNITAFCLTVDKNGHDYLKTMCDDMGYEVLDDIYTLPQRLLYLYKRLTM